MSHYAVAVIHRADQDVADLLAPYNEHLEVEPYLWFTKADAIKYVKIHYKTEDKTDDECWAMMVKDRKTDCDGNIYSTYNPQSKWDWWVEGGRFCDKLKLKNGYETEGKIKDIDFSIDEEDYQAALRWWDVVIDHQLPEEYEEYDCFYKEEYFREYYVNRETFARMSTEFTTYAVVTPDGVWHSPGNMGWFGCSDESAEELRDWHEHYMDRFIDGADPEWILTIVDCHI